MVCAQKYRYMGAVGRGLFWAGGLKDPTDPFWCSGGTSRESGFDGVSTEMDTLAGSRNQSAARTVRGKSHNPLQWWTRREATSCELFSNKMAGRGPRNRAADIAHVAFRDAVVGGMGSVVIARHTPANVKREMAYIMKTGDYSKMCAETAKEVLRCFQEAIEAPPVEAVTMVGTHGFVRGSESQYSLTTIAPRRDIEDQREAFNHLFNPNGDGVDLNSLQFMFVTARNYAKAGPELRRQIEREVPLVMARLDAVAGHRVVVPAPPTDDQVEEAEDSDYVDNADEDSDDDDDLLGFADDESDVVLGDATAGAGVADGVGDGAAAAVSPSPVKRVIQWVRDRVMGSG